MNKLNRLNDSTKSSLITNSLSTVLTNIGISSSFHAVHMISLIFHYSLTDLFDFIIKDVFIKGTCFLCFIIFLIWSNIWIEMPELVVSLVKMLNSSYHFCKWLECNFIRFIIKRTRWLRSNIIHDFNHGLSLNNGA